MTQAVKGVIKAILLLVIACVIPNGLAYWELASHGDFSRGPADISVESIRMMYFAVTVDMIVLVCLFFLTVHLWRISRVSATIAKV